MKFKGAYFDDGEDVFWISVLSGRDALAVFQFIEEPFEKNSLFIEPFVEYEAIITIFPWWDAGPSLLFIGVLSLMFAPTGLIRRTAGSDAEFPFLV